MSASRVLDDPLLDAAFHAFARYGYRRTTMGDVAEAAGMSRPAVYLRVANKGELLTAVARALLDAALAESERIAAGSGPVADRVHAILATKQETVLLLAARSEHAVELLAEYARQDPGDAAVHTERLEALVARVLDVERAAEVAALLTRCTAGLEADLHTPELARRRLRLLVELVVGGLAPDPTPEDPP